MENLSGGKVVLAQTQGPNPSHMTSIARVQMFANVTNNVRCNW